MMTSAFGLSPSHRELLISAVQREFLQRHQGALLGATWSILQPLALIAIYTLVFSKVMQGRMPGVTGEFGYSLYLCAGLLPWGFFAEGLARGQNAFLEHAGLLRRTQVPLMLPPVAALMGAGLNFVIIGSLFALVLALLGSLPSPQGLVLFATALVIQVWMALALGVLLGALTVFFRDIAPATGLLLQFGFWFTPIVYPVQVLPGWAADVLGWVNPMFHLVAWHQAAVLHQPMPDPSTLLPSLVWAMLATLATWGLLRRHGAEIPDLV